MRWRLVLGLVLLVGCSKPKDAEDTSPATTQSVTASSAKRFYRSPAPIGSLDLIATESGRSFHSGAANGCTDKQCLGGKCGPLCSRFIQERFKTFATVGQKNRLYFSCFGGCLEGYIDGGAPDAAH